MRPTKAAYRLFYDSGAQKEETSPSDLLFNRFGANISWQPFTVISILNRLAGAAADACHTMGAILSPYGFLMRKTNVVQRANLDALSAGNTGAGRIKLFRVNKHGVKELIHNAAVYLILKFPGRQ